MSSVSGNLTILLVDDDLRILQVFADALAELGGFRVLTAQNGLEGLERFLDARPDCVVIDVKMPQIDGYQMARVLRGDPDTADIPLVILTAMAQEQDRFIGKASGVDLYLTKPVKPTALIAAIHQAISLSAADRVRRMRDLAESPGN